MRSSLSRAAARGRAPRDRSGAGLQDHLGDHRAAVGHLGRLLPLDRGLVRRDLEVVGLGRRRQERPTPNKQSYDRDLREFTAAFADDLGQPRGLPARRLADRRGPRHQPLGGRPPDPALDRRRPARRGLERGADGGVPRPGRPRQAGRRSSRSRATGKPAADAQRRARRAARRSRSRPRRRAAAEQGLAFVYVSPNVGLASGGHAALRADDTVYHLQNARRPGCSCWCARAGRRSTWSTPSSRTGRSRSRTWTSRPR